MRKLFKGGIHPSACKGLTDRCAIEVMPSPAIVAIPISQHIGKPAKVVVEVGQEVKMGQLIAQCDGAISANIFSSVSGKVKEIKVLPTPTGACEHIVIENDGNDEEVRLQPIENPDSDSVVERLVSAGIIGMGGAGFPAGVKFRPTSPVDTLVVNAAECEPYVNCDNRIMIEYASEFIDGVKLLMTAGKVNKAYIAVEDNKPLAIKTLNDYLTENGIDDIVVSVLKTKYPQGSEKHIIYSATGRVVPLGSLPASVGVIVTNTHTALSTHYAVREGIPLYKRIMTVTGEGITTPKNIWVSGGTSYNQVIDFCGGTKEGKRVVKMISGGPMMGFAVAGGVYACGKTTSCIILMTDGEAFTGAPSACINCGRCAKACPMNLMPMYMDAYSRVGDWDGAVKYGLNACIECGCCTYVCPAKRTLVQSFRLAKRELRGRKK